MEGVDPRVRPEEEAEGVDRPDGGGGRRRIVLPLGLLLAVSAFAAARIRPDWPWFSLWLLALLAGAVAFSIPRVRGWLDLSPFRGAVAMLAGVAVFNLFLFHVETHRHRSERLEVGGVWFDANVDAIRIGVGEPDLDVRLDGSLHDFERWSLEVRPLGGDRFAIERLRGVDLLRLRADGALPWRDPLVPVSGAPLTVGAPLGLGTDSLRVEAPMVGGLPTLVWGSARAPLALDDEILGPRLSSALRRGVSLAELEWSDLPDRALAEDRVITRTSTGRVIGRLRLTAPAYRITSRSGEAGGESPDGGAATDAPGTAAQVGVGDTLWVSSRGRRWAVAVDRVPGVSRVAAPTAIRFVEGPRTEGWPLPSGEVCGREADRCAVVSTGTLPPPQPRFALGGFGLDTTRYAVLARVESDREGVRLVGARETRSFAYGEEIAYEARALRDGPEAGLLLRVSRAADGRQSAVILTVAGLFALLLGALLLASGDARVWALRTSRSPHATAAWGFLNLLLVFLGVRLALGLRVAYTPPFYERAAVTAVGLWVTVALLLVALARWSVWTPTFFRWVRKLERPFSRLFLPGWSSEPAPATGVGFTLGGPSDENEEDNEALRRARGRSWVGAMLSVPALIGLIVQRPEAAAGILVAAVALAGWLAMGVARRRGGHWPLTAYPLRVVTADAETERPSLAFGMAAGGSVVLVLAMHAPELALVPVLGLLVLFGVDGLARLRPGPAERRAWWVLAALAAMLTAGALLFAPSPGVGAGSVLVLTALAALLLTRRGPVPVGGEAPAPRRMQGVQAGFDDLRTAVLSGVGWVGVLLVLVALVFLNSREIPPFVRFGLVFTLFLMAIRAGLACGRVLRQNSRWGRVEALALLVIPVGVLLVFMLFDFGLGLVFFVPMFLTVLLSARIDRLPGTLALGAVAIVALIGVVAGSVLRPSLGGVASAADLVAFDREFRTVGNPLVDGLRTAGLSGPITRATVRSIAASDPGLLEEALAFAGPSEALVAAAPSLEQVWGGRAYAAGGWTGTGFAGTVLLGRGIPTAVSFAENTFSVYILSEHGALGGIAVLLTYLALLGVVAVWITRVHGTVQDTPLGLAVVALVVGGIAWLTVPAVYVAASNLGVVPLTGQNMPFLGLNSWADVVLVSGLMTAVLSGLVAMDETAVEEAA